MGRLKVNAKDLMFILKEQLNYGRLCALDRYKEQNERILDMLVKEAIGFAKGVGDPLNEIGETVGLRFENNRVICPPEFRSVFKQYGADGWTAAARDTEYGGQGFPNMMRIVINDLMYGACQSLHLSGPDGFRRDHHVLAPVGYGGHRGGSIEKEEVRLLPGQSAPGHASLETCLRSGREVVEMPEAAF